MAAHQSASFTGVPRNNIRPGSFAVQSDVADISNDQAYLYERIAGIKVPGSATISATPHIHDGADEAKLPVPLAQVFLGADLAPHPNWTASAEYKPFSYVPIFVPAGVSEVLIVLYQPGSAGAIEGVKMTVQDTSFVQVDKQPFVTVAGHWSGGSGVTTSLATVAVTAGAVNLFKLEAFDGTLGDGVKSSRLITSYSILPVTTPPKMVEPAYEPTLVTAGEYNTPADFQGVDTALTADDRSFNSWLATTMAKNDQVNTELATGWPAGNKATTDVAGHIHADGTVAAGEAGAGIDLSLGSWHYGVARARNASDDEFNTTQHMVFDNIDSSIRESWGGRIHGPVYFSGRGADSIVARHRFRIPAQTDANLGIHASAANKINVAIIARADLDSSSGARFGVVKVQILDSSLGAGSTSAVTILNKTGTGNFLEYATSTIQLPSTFTGTGDDAVLEVRMNCDQLGPRLLVYGVCVWYEN